MFNQEEIEVLFRDENITPENKKKVLPKCRGLNKKSSKVFQVRSLTMNIKGLYSKVKI